MESLTKPWIWEKPGFEKAEPMITVISKAGKGMSKGTKIRRKTACARDTLEARLIELDIC